VIVGDSEEERKGQGARQQQIFRFYASTPAYSRARSTRLGETQAQLNDKARSGDWAHGEADTRTRCSTRSPPPGRWTTSPTSFKKEYTGILDPPSCDVAYAGADGRSHGDSVIPSPLSQPVETREMTFASAPV